MARPQGEIRQVLRDTVARLVPERGAVNYRQVAAAAQVGFAVTQVTLRNMARAGELCVVGKYRPAGARTWHCLYEPPEAWSAVDALTGAMKGWKVR